MARIVLLWGNMFIISVRTSTFIACLPRPVWLVMMAFAQRKPRGLRQRVLQLEQVLCELMTTRVRSALPHVDHAVTYE